MSTQSFCSNCGSRLEKGDQFCNNCGVGVNIQNSNKTNTYQQPQSSSYSQYNQYQGRQGNPMIPQLQYEGWREKNVFKTGSQLYTNTEETATSILLSPGTPNPIGIVFALSCLNAFLLFILETKLSSALTNETGFQATVRMGPIVFAFITPFFGYFIGPGIVNAIMRGGFPYGSVQHQQSQEIFRRLWGFLLLASVGAAIILIPVAMSVTPEISSDDTYVYAAVPSSYYRIEGIVNSVTSLINIYIFRKSCIRLHNTGGGLTAVTAIWLILVVFGYIASSSL